MKRFIVKSIVFVIIPLLYFGASTIINYLIYTTQTPILNDARILIVGDSHPQTSFNPELFSSAQNISQHGEPYVVTFWKLDKIFQSFTPDTLILGFAPHNITKFNDLKFSNAKFSGKIFRRAYPIAHFNDIDDEVVVDYLLYYQSIWKKIVLYPQKNHIRYIGRYSNTNSNNVSRWNKIIKRHYYTRNKENGQSDLSISYLDSIVNLCERKKIVLVLANSPVHENYGDNIPAAMTERFDMLKKKYSNQAIIIDEMQSQYPDSLFLDPDHLNSSGATKFTKEVIGLLQNNR